MGKVILVASGKGGTGKTMFAVNLGATLAKKGRSVVMIDLDLGLRNLDLYFGLENNVVYDVHDVLTGMCKIKQALIKDKNFNGLYLLASSPERSDGSLTPLHMKVLCEKLRADYDYVIVDDPAGIDDGLVLAAAGVDSAVIVCTPDYSAIRDADNLDRELIRLGITNRLLVVNNVDAELMAEGYVPRLKDITEMLKPELIGVIQSDQNIRVSTNMGIPIVIKDGTYIAENFRNIAERIEDKESKENEESVE